MDKLLPSNSTPLEVALEETAVKRISKIRVPIRELYNPDLCPVKLLPWLAWQLSVDIWREDWSEEQKRQMIKRSIAVHRIKGTRKALELALGALYVDVEVVEWFETEPRGEAYTFDLRVHLPAGYQMDAQTYDEIRAVTASAKNLRSHLGTIELTSAEIEQSAIASAAVVAGHKFVIYELGRQDPELLEY